MADFQFETLNERQMRALADAHIRMYENRVRKAKQGFKGIRLDECERFLGIWKSIGSKLGQGNWRLRLTRPEVNEIRDALASGDYDVTLNTMKDPPS